MLAREKMKSREKIYKVIEITRLIKRSLEDEFQDVWIEGEVSNLRQPKSGHVYFTIKDEYSQIQAVKFRPSKDDVFSRIKDGDKVRAFGNISVYEKSGQYQIYVQTAEKLGIGDLQVLFNQLKEKLQSEGLFEKKYKKTIPALPRTIAIITSPTGAAIRDMLNVLDRRFSNVHVLVYPVKVQGEGAAAEIEDALDTLNDMNEADVIIVGRGGGSLEDLWAFNEERVARAIFRSKIPVISAVGHEIDYTIADFTADLRAETPTAAAEMVLKKKEDFFISINRLEEKMIQVVQYFINDFRSRLKWCVDHHAMKEPQHQIAQFRQRIDETQWRLKQIITQVIKLALTRVNKEEEKLGTLNPLNILARGYSITQDFHTKTILKDVKSITRETKLETLFHKGRVVSVVSEISQGHSKKSPNKASSGRRRKRGDR